MQLRQLFFCFLCLATNQSYSQDADAIQNYVTQLREIYRNYTVQVQKQKSTDRTQLLPASPEAALEPFVNAVDRNNPPAQLNLGIALSIIKHHRAARSALERAIELNPKSGVAHGWLGDNSFWAHDCPAAVKAYSRALTLAPGDRFTASPWETYLGLCHLTLKDYEAAIVACSRGGEPQHESGKAYCRGRANIGLGRHEDALELFWEAEKGTTGQGLLPDKGTARDGIIAALVKLNRVEEAVRLTSEWRSYQQNADTVIRAGRATLERWEKGAYDRSWPL